MRIAEAGLQRVREDLARRQKDLQNLEAAKVHTVGYSGALRLHLVYLLSLFFRVS